MDNAFKATAKGLYGDTAGNIVGRDGIIGSAASKSASRRGGSEGLGGGALVELIGWR